MIKETEIIVNGHRGNYDFYKKLGYNINYRKPCFIKVKDLMFGSTVKITSICDKCNKESKKEFKEYYNYTKGFTEPYYCNKCKTIKCKKTCLEKYGVDNPMKSKIVKDKLKSSLLEKYGVDHYSKTEEYKEKFKSTCVEKYGVENPFSSDEIKYKIINTNIEKFGVEYPQQSLDIKIKSEETNLKKYGFKKFSQTEECKLKVINSNIEKFGVNSYSKTDEYKERVKSSNIEKYGVDHFSKTEEYKQKIKKIREDRTKIKYQLFLEDDYNIISYTDYNFVIHHNRCNKEFLIDKDLFYARNNLEICICTNCNPKGLQYSSLELDMHEFLNLYNINYDIKNKNILNGLELDIYIPEHNLAIEMNGVYWHNELYKDENYHLNKTLLCKEKGIQLLHIWEDDWKYKCNIIKSIILNKLSLLKTKIYARKCKIKQVESKQAREFLDINHIQGYSPSQLKLGLFYENELVSLMTFGWRYTNSKKEYELIRFCNKINFNIIGAASKLFCHFLKNQNIECITSYADISLFSGSIYEKLGFIKSHLSKPNYFWVVKGVRKHRFNFNKQKLVKEGFDANKTEIEIMHERGYYRVFSCGQEKWIYKI